MRPRLKERYPNIKNTSSQKDSFRPYIISIMTIVLLTYFTVGIQNITTMQQNIRDDASKMMQKKEKTCVSLGKAIDTNGLLQCALSQKSTPQHMKLSYAAFFAQDVQSNKN